MLKAKEFLKDDMVFPQIPKMLKNRGDLRKWKLLQDKGFDRRGIKLYKKERVKKIDLRKRVFFLLRHKVFENSLSET